MGSKKLYRTEGPYKMVAGVCGGLGEYFDIDPTVVRVLCVVAIFFSFSAADSFRNDVLKVPSISPSRSIYAPAIRVMEVLFTVIRLVSSSISSLSIIPQLPSGSPFTGCR